MEVKTLDLSTMTDDQKKIIAQQAIASPLKRPEFAGSVGINPNTLALWIKKYKVNPRGQRKQKAAPAIQKSNQVTVFKGNERDLMALQQAVEDGNRRFDELFSELEDTKDKLASLQKVILVLGHQLD